MCSHCWVGVIMTADMSAQTRHLLNPTENTKIGSQPAQVLVKHCNYRYYFELSAFCCWNSSASCIYMKEKGKREGASVIQMITWAGEALVSALQSSAEHTRSPANKGPNIFLWIGASAFPWCLGQSEAWTMLVLAAFLISPSWIHFLMLYEGEFTLHSCAQWGTAIRSCSSSLLPSSLNWKNFFWRLLLLCQVWLEMVNVFSVIHQQRTAGGMDEHRHFILETFFSQKARLRGRLWNRDHNPRRLPPPSSISCPLNYAVVSVQWIQNLPMQNNTAFTRGSKNTTFFPLSCLPMALVSLARTDVTLNLLRYWWEGGPVLHYLLSKVSVKSLLK